MGNYNKIFLMGNLTRDPTMKYLPSNTPVVEFGLAVNRRFRRQDGEQGEETLFVDCEAFGRTAEVINQYLKKGKPIFVEGRLKLDQWQDKDGNKRSKHRVTVESFQFVDSRGGDNAAGHGSDEDHGSAPQGQGDGQHEQHGGYNTPRPAPPPQQGRANPALPPSQSQAPEMESDDIPF